MTAPSLKHNFVSSVGDGADSAQVQPSNWNEEHKLTGTANSLIGIDGSGNGVEYAIDTDVALAANSDTRFATQKAIKAYADQLIAANDAMVFKGVVDCSTSPNYPAADRGHTYRVSVAGKIGGASGTNVEAGDLLLCLTDSTSSGNHATVGSAWSVVQVNLDGAVIGPASVTDSRIAVFDTTTGKLLKDGGKTVAELATLLSPTFTGTPAAPTATAGTNTTQLATTAFVQQEKPVKAAGSDVRTGTDDAKFATSKALGDSQAFFDLTDGATISWDMRNGYNAKVTLGGSRTLATPTHPVEGQAYSLQVIQDGTGSRGLTLPASTIFDFGGAGAPTFSTGAGKIDLLTLFCLNASTPLFRVFFAKGS